MVELTQEQFIEIFLRVMAERNLRIVSNDLTKDKTAVIGFDDIMIATISKDWVACRLWDELMGKGFA